MFVNFVTPDTDEVTRLEVDYLHSVGFEVTKWKGGGLIEEQIVELTFRIALCGFFNPFNDALMIGVENGVNEDLLKHGSNIDELPKQPGISA